MAANVLKQFLVGIGFDTREFEKGTRKVDAGVGSMKSGILTASAAIVGAFGAAAASALNTANEVDRIALRAANLNTSINFINAFGGALRLAGGDAGAAIDQITGIEDALRALKLEGEFSAFAQAVPSGIDVLPLTQARDAEEFLRLLAPQMQGLDAFGRRQVGEALGLDDAAIRVLTEGFDTYIEKARAATGDISELAESSRELNSEFAELGLKIKGFTNELAEKTIPGLTNLAKWVNGFIDENRDMVSAGIDFISENQGAAGAVGVGAGLAATGAAATKIGLGAAGGALSKAGTAGVVLGTSVVAADATNSLLAKYLPGYTEASRSLDEFIQNVTGLERIPSPSEFFFGISPDAVREGGTPAVQMQSAEAEREANARVLREAISRQPVVVNSNIRVELDGEKMDKRIEEVNERAAYSALEDLQQTTGR